MRHVDTKSLSGILLCGPSASEQGVGKAREAAVSKDTAMQRNAAHALRSRAKPGAGFRIGSKWLCWVALGLFGLGAGLVVPQAAAQATITVNSTADNTTGSDGECTLREAIINANAIVDMSGGDCMAGTNSGTDTIEFDLGAGPYIITPGSTLPDITSPLIIDGESQLGTDCGADIPSRTLLVVLDGSGAGVSSGLTLGPGSSGSTIRGLVINQWGGFGVLILTSNNTVECNFIGTDETGAIDLGNGFGVVVEGDSPSSGSTNTIGGATAGAGNLISGNDGDGVVINASDDNVVHGNFVGTDKDGTAALPNDDGGVVIANIVGMESGAKNSEASGVSSTGNFIGGAGPGEGNVISGNTGNGVLIVDGDGNFVQGNNIGTDVGGAADLGNQANGVGIDDDATDNEIGGNIIAFNDLNGVAVVDGGGSSTGNVMQGNSIFQNDGIGIDLVGGVEDPQGVTANDPGDIDTGPNNLQNTPTIIFAQINADDELYVTYSAESDPVDDLIINFYIADVDNEEGQTEIGSPVYTAAEFGTSKTTFLGSATGLGVSPGDFLVATAIDVAGNTSEFSAAIEVVPAVIVVNTTADNTTAADGFCTLREAIGNANTDTDTTGADCASGGGADLIEFNIPGAGPHTISPTSPLPDLTDQTTIDGETQLNADCGAGIPSRDLQVVLDGSGAGAGAIGLTLALGSDGSVIRGLVINQWSDAGVSILEGDSNIVECNFIGTDVTGTVDLGNGLDGVIIDSNADGNTIGGTAGDVGNLISGNGGSGVFINLSDNNVVEGNFIGTDKNGTAALGNTSGGVGIAEIMMSKNGSAADVSSTGNVVGGLAPGAGNVIADNGFNGVFIVSGDGNFVQHNNIGTDVGGAADLGNTGDGVRLNLGATNNAVEFNTIAFNTQNGVALLDGGSTGNAIQGNSIFQNDLLGIDLGSDGTTANDVNDPDIGANNLQNFPVITGAVIDGSGNLIVTYAVDSDPADPNITYDRTVESFEADAADEEGQSLIGGDTYTAGDFPGAKQVDLGNAAGLNVGVGDRLVATATDDADNTSEFSFPAVGVVIMGPIVVNTTADNTTAADGFCTLREAITNANADTDTTGGDCNAGGVAVDAIEFNIIGTGPHTIAPANALPNIADPVTMDGETQPGADCGVDIPSRDLRVILDGSLVAGLADGVVLGPGSDGSVVRGLAVHQWTSNGVVIGASTGNTVECNNIGTDVTGTVDLGNGFNGVAISNGADGNMIGGTGGAGNLISGNDLHGVHIDNASTNVVQGNNIGTDAAGAADLGNTGDGVRIENGAAETTIGGTGAGNTIAFNNNGINLLDPSIGTAIRRNAIFENDQLGIDLNDDGATANDLNDPDLGPNGLQNFPTILGAFIDGFGNLLVTYAVASDPADPNITYDLTVEFFEADAADEEGQRFVGTDTYTNGDFPGTRQANLGNAAALGLSVGDRLVATATDALGTGNTSEFSFPAIGVQQQGVPLVVNTTADNLTAADGFCTLREAINNVNNNDETTGGDCAAGGAALDVIAFNIPLPGVQTLNPATPWPVLTDPVVLDGETQPGADCGADIPSRTLLIALAGGVAGVGSGVVLGLGSDGSTIRGFVINQWADSGVEIDGSDSNVVECSYIGTDASGMLAPGNGTSGVAIQNGASGNLVGGTSADAGNLISGNLEQGVLIDNATTNDVQGNFVGTDKNGTAILANDVGVRIDNGASDNVVGGTAAGVENLISGNGADAVSIANSTNNRVEGNLIGTDVTGAATLSNVQHGVVISGGATGNTVGGTAAGAGNTIAFNNQNGVVVLDATSTGNAILGNGIFENAGLGIDLGDDGPTANDPDDPDVGPNNLQNTVVLTEVQRVAGVSTTVDGTLNSTPSTAFRIEIFSSPVADPSGFGEGQTFHGFVNVNTNAVGNTSFSLVISQDLSGEFIAATATDENNNTSEFSLGPPLTTVDLTLTKTDGDASAVPGDVVIYTLNYANVGDEDATGVTLLENVPDFANFDAENSDPGWVDLGDRTFGLNLGNVPVGTGGAVAFAVRVNAILPAGVEELTNTASIADDGASGPDANPADNDAADTTPVAATPDLRVTKEATLDVDQDGDGLADPGDVIHYHIEIENTGNRDAGAVVFTDAPDANTTLTVGSVNPSQGSVTSGNGQGDTAVAVDLGVVPVDATVSVDFRVTVKDPLPPGIGAVSNQGSVSGSNFQPLPTDDPTIPGPGNPTVTLLDTAALIIATKQDQLFDDQDGDGIADPGDILVYTITLQNTGNAAAAAVVFTDMPGANTTLVAGSVSPSQGSVTSGNGQGDTNVVVEVGAVPGGGTVTITFRVMVDQPFEDDLPQIQNQGQITGTNIESTATDDPDTAEPNDPTVTPVDLFADLSLDKSASTTTADVGSEVEFVLTLTNDGPAGAIVEVTDVLPEGLTFVRADPSGDYDSGSGVWSVGFLAPNASVTLTITALVETTETVTNTAEVTASSVDDPDSTPEDGAGDDFSQATVTGQISVIEADPASVDFGAVDTDTVVDRDVTVTNVGEVEVEIVSLSLRGGGGDFSIVSGGESGALAVGAARVVSLQFAPTSGGAKVDTLEIVTTTRTLLVPLRGVGLLIAYTVDPTALDFGSLLVGSSRVDSVEVTNIGDVDLDVTDVGIGGDDAADFSVVRGGGALPVGATRFIVVRFTPSQRGTRSAQLTFTIRGDALVVSLEGEGLAAEIAVDPESVDFGDVLPGDSTKSTVTITNVGNLDLEITSLLIAGSDTSAFSLVSGTPGVLPPGASLTVVMCFAPGRVGAHVDALDIGSTAGDVSVALQGNGLAPTVTVTLPPDAPMADEDAEVDVSTDEGFDPTESRLFYRRGGEEEYQQEDLEEAAAAGKQAAFTGVIPADFVTERGVDYYVRLSDGRTTITFPETDPSENPAHVRVRVDALTSTATATPETFRMVSVPLVLDEAEAASVLVDDYGEFDITRWRLFRWQSDGGVYGEFPNLGATFTPGTAFWLITDEGGAFDVGSGLSVDASEPFRLTLPSGWSQISTPFAFAVPWDRVEATGEVEAPVAYDGVSYQYDQTALQPWEGYFVFNTEPSPVTLTIPPVEAGAVAGKHASAGSISASGAYTLRLVAELPDYGLHDSQNVLGLADAATDGRDDMDRAEAPPIGDYVRLSIVDEGERFAANFKPAQGDGQRWEVDVTAAIESEAVALRRHVRIRLVEQGQLPEGFRLYVIDRDYDTPVQLEANAFAVTLSTDEPARHFSVIVGTEGFAATHSDGVPLTPLTDHLEQNYPNPFNPETVIAYQLGRRSRVVLDIYDGLGRRVRTLVDAEQTTGRHEVVWDGRNDAGRHVASGLYFYRLRAGSFNATRAMTLLR